MKKKQKDLVWAQMAVNSSRKSHSFSEQQSVGGWLRKVFGSLIALICVCYFIYALNLLFSHNYACWHPIISSTSSSGSSSTTEPLALRSLNATKNVSDGNSDDKNMTRTSHRKTIQVISLKPVRRESSNGTDLKHIVFGIASTARYWDSRKEYIKLWWRPKEMRGFVWVEKPVKGKDSSLPPLRISGNTSHFKYSNKQGHRSAIRISRIVSETFRMGLPDAHWFVMGDDDTVFIADNLVRVLSKYDHQKFYYIGSLSESHLQNIFFSYSMAYGGGGFAISYPLAKALESMQDQCIQRYPGLYGSDDRMQACMSELGVPLTKEPGFHQVQATRPEGVHCRAWTSLGLNVTSEGHPTASHGLLSDSFPCFTYHSGFGRLERKVVFKFVQLAGEASLIILISYLLDLFAHHTNLDSSASLCLL